MIVVYLCINNIFGSMNGRMWQGLVAGNFNQGAKMFNKEEFTNIRGYDQCLWIRQIHLEVSIPSQAERYGNLLVSMTVRTRLVKS